jgi:hypothetical protein
MPKRFDPEAERDRQEGIAIADALGKWLDDPVEQAEHDAWLARRRKWESLPPSRAPHGTPTHQMTEQQIFTADQDEGR